MSNSVKILSINPGSTSTKIAVFSNEDNVFLKNIKHSADDLAGFTHIADQFEFRKNIILKELKDAGINIQELSYIVGRGGLVKPIPSGLYEVNEALITDLKKGVQGEHASNLGGLIAKDLANTIQGARAFIADPVVVDELEPIARISGHPAVERISIFHALNQKAIARTYARELGRPYESLNLIIAHLGGGVSVGAHKQGKVIDVNNALDGDGPFSPERSGGLPVGSLVKLCFSGQYSLEEVKKIICGKGGYVGYLGTNDAYQVEQKAAAGDEKAKAIQEAMAYQIGKEIGAMAAVLKGKVDAILFTGGIAHSKSFIADVSEMVAFIAPIKVYPGEDEMKALAMNAFMLHKGEIEIKQYR
ncbi:MAG: butyrate kinase [Bacteroidales bacterium]